VATARRHTQRRVSASACHKGRDRPCWLPIGYELEGDDEGLNYGGPMTMVDALKTLKS
jgi:hypothetical protein